MVGFKLYTMISALLNGKPNYRAIMHLGITMNITSPNYLIFQNAKIKNIDFSFVF